MANLPCCKCDSSDGVQFYDDHYFCYACDSWISIEEYEGGETKPSPSTPSNTDKDWFKGVIQALPHRKINKETCQKYRYGTSTFKGRPIEIATYKDNYNNTVFQKIRYTDKKEFFSVGKPSVLFGQHLFGGSNFNTTLVITEGEIDCLTVSQVQGNKYPVVSIPTGADKRGNKTKAIRDNLEWIEKFNSVVFMFDNDEPGIKTAEECAALLSVGKAKIAYLPLKDPNEMLKAGRSGEIITAIHTAKEWRPDGVVNGNELWEVVNTPISMGLSYPFPTLTKATYGTRIPEYTVIGAGTGIGKTTIFSEFESHFILEHKERVGIIHLEQTDQETCLQLMSRYLKKPIFLPDVEVSEEERREAFDKTVGNGNVFLYKAFGTKSFDKVKSIIKYLVTGCECKYIFLDHISALGSGVKAGADVNQTMKNISSELAALTRELSFGLHAISHLRKSNNKKSWENGAIPTIDDFEGTGDITKWADFVFAISRNKHAKGIDKNKSYFHCLKDRYTGKADGLVFPIMYNPNTCRLVEVDNVEDLDGFTEEEEDDGGDL